MKLKFLVTLITSFIVFAAVAQKSGHELTFHIKGLKNDTVQFAYHQGSGKFLQDSVVADANGKFVIKGDKPLQPGIYLIVMPNNTYFELIVNEQAFSIATTMENPVANMEIKGSVENQLFYNYLNFLNPIGEEITKKREKYDNTKEGKEKDAIMKNIQDLEAKVKAYKDDIIAKNPKTFVAMMFKAMEDPQIPEAPKNATKDESQRFRYWYYRTHFFDNIDFTDDRLIRTPFFQNKIDYFFDKMIPQHPDTITRIADGILKQTKGNKEMFKYLLTYITTKYQKSKIMGMDEVFVHMGKNYFLTDKVDWLDSSRVEKIEEEVMKLQYNLLGNPAVNITVEDKAGKPFKLYDIDAEFLVLFFYDVNCGHCKKVAPKLKEVYDEFKQYDVKVLAVPINREKTGWDKFINDFGLEEWIHGWEPSKEQHYRVYYNIFSTPTMYILDKDKKIIGKNLNTDIIQQILSDKVK